MSEIDPSFLAAGLSAAFCPSPNLAELSRVRLSGCVLFCQNINSYSARSQRCPTARYPVQVTLGAQMSMKVLTIGGAMIDRLLSHSGRVERMSMSNAHSSFLLLEEGRKTEAEEVSTHVGDGAVNVSVAMARLGLDVAVLAKFGADPRAETILQRLEEEGVSTACVKRDPRSPTGTSVFISSHDRNAAIFTFRGANTLLEAEDLQQRHFCRCGLRCESE